MIMTRIHSKTISRIKGEEHYRKFTSRDNRRVIKVYKTKWTTPADFAEECAMAQKHVDAWNLARELERQAAYDATRSVQQEQGGMMYG